MASAVERIEVFQAPNLLWAAKQHGQLKDDVEKIALVDKPTLYFKKKLNFDRLGSSWRNIIVMFIKFK